MKAHKTTTYRNLDVDETGDVVATVPVSISSIVAFNLSASTPHYLKLYDQTDAPDNSDTPVMTILLPPADEASNPVVIPYPAGREPGFSNGLGIRAVAELADNGNTGAGANEVVVNIVTIENFYYTQ